MTEQRTDLAAIMPTVAKALFGEPSKENSSRTDWRYRRKGSLSIDVAKGTWFDHEAGQGGGVLDLIRKERQCSTGEALRWLENIGEYVAPVQPVEADPNRAISLRESAIRIWRETRPAGGTVAERYLVSRGLHHGAGVEDIRFHPRCPFGKDEAGFQRFVPGMVALVRAPGDGRPMGVHRTELSADGRKIDRKMLGPCHGGIVALGPHEADHGIGICEGIETGLAVVKLGGGPIWACLSAGSLAGFAVLGGVPKLSIFADNDPAGIEAAQKCARRWVTAGAEVTIQVPQTKGNDFADELEQHERGQVA